MAVSDEDRRRYELLVRIAEKRSARYAREAKRKEAKR